VPPTGWRRTKARCGQDRVGASAIPRWWSKGPGVWIGRAQCPRPPGFSCRGAPVGAFGVLPPDPRRCRSQRGVRAESGTTAKAGSAPLGLRTSLRPCSEAGKGDQFCHSPCPGHIPDGGNHYSPSATGGGRRIGPAGESDHRAPDQAIEAAVDVHRQAEASARLQGTANGRNPLPLAVRRYQGPVPLLASVDTNGALSESVNQ
jgi:hypothetical protein